MKKKILSALSVLALSSVSMTAWSVPISVVESADNLIASANLGNSGDPGVAKWVSDQLGTTVEFGDKVECDSGCGWETVTGTSATDLYAFELTSSATWFLVKTGNGSQSGARHFLFENVGSLAFAVFSLSQLGFGSDVTITKVSHVSAFDPTSVPEPSVVALLGVGLLGLALARRRKATRA